MNVRGWMTALWVAWACPVAGEPVSRTPYAGAIVLDAGSGAVLYEDRADHPGHPAGMVNLVNLFILFDAIQAGTLQLDDDVKVTKAAANIGGVQVYLDEREVFSVDQMIRAVTIETANDAALALAAHVAGHPDAFVRLMNEKARALGLSPATQFVTVHGLPPGKGNPVNTTTARDFARLCRALIHAHPDVLRYTAMRQHVFRQQPRFEIRSANRLLGAVPGCDGLMTGYTREAGHSIAVTAERDGRRLIIVILGSRDRQIRDGFAVEWIERFLPPAGVAVPAEP